MPLLLLVAAGGCRSKPKGVAVASVGDAMASSGPLAGLSAADSGAPSSQTEPVFSAPIAAARAGGVSIVAGLVATKGVIRVVGLKDGRALWSTDAVSGAKWSAGAELGLQRAADGVSLVWRDGLGAAGAGTLVLIGVDGAVRGAPIPIGAATCTTVGGLAWIEPRGACEPPPEHAAPGAMRPCIPAPVRVLARAWAASEPRVITTISPDRSPTLVCGTHQVFVLGDGDDDLTVDTFVPNDASGRRPTFVMRDSEFPDEEREHEAFTVGDDLEVLRVGLTGSVATRVLPADHAPSPWRRLKHVLSEDDDLVAVDGQPLRTLAVFTRDADAACPGTESGGQQVRAFDIDRSSGADRLVDLAPPDCHVQRGPFWIPVGLPEPLGSVVAWVERGGGGASRPDGGGPPISSMAYRVVGPDGVRSGRVALAADAVVDGDCDERGCYAAALLREPESDGMVPGPIGVIAYP